ISAGRCPARTRSVVVAARSGREGLKRAIAVAVALLPAIAAAQAPPVSAEPAPVITLPPVEVVAPSPLGGVGIDRDKVPGTARSVNAEDFARTASPYITETLFQRIPNSSLS